MDNKAKLQELRAEHGDVVSFETRGQLFAFRCPTLDEFESYQSKVIKAGSDSKSKLTIGTLRRELCGLCLVHPTLKDGEPSALHAIFERAPMVATKVTDALVDLAEGEIEVVVKKD